MLNEKIYIFLWFWFSFISIATFFSIFIWIGRLFCKISRRRYVAEFLKRMDAFSQQRHYNGPGTIQADKIVLNAFVHNLSRVDGVFVLRMLADKAGDILVAEVLCSMWVYFKTHGTEKKIFIGEGNMNVHQLNSEGGIGSASGSLAHRMQNGFRIEKGKVFGHTKSEQHE